MLTSPWHIQLLGGLRVRRAEQAIDRFRSHRTGALLAYLACHLRRTHSREELIELFWPEADIEAGRSSLRTALSSLRHQLEPPGTPPGTVLLADRQNVRLRSEAIQTDIADFEAALQAARRVFAPEQAEETARHLQHAIAAYHGPLLPGYYEDWILGERERLAAAYQNALCQLALILQQTGHGEQALDYARRAVVQNALDEQAHCLVMRLYAANQQHDAALQQYAVLERVLQAELQTTPSASTQALYHLLQSQPAAGTMLLLEGAALEGVGVSAPSPAHSGVHAPSSPAAALSTPSPSSPSKAASDAIVPLPAEAPVSEGAEVRLPLQFTRFFGRESEREELAMRLRDALRSGVSPSTERLFTVTGPGGVGKTRFAVETGRVAAAGGTQRVVFVPLADVENGARLLSVIAGALLLPLVAEDALPAQVAETLRATPTLLILDNFEQLLNSIPDPGGDAKQNLQQGSRTDEAQAGEAESPALTALARLREEAPRLVLLVTSRQRLNLPGEREVPLLPLLTPEYPGTVERLLEFASVHLFVDRARAARPDFQITPRNSGDIAALCQGLEGIPLAIELMAAWAQTLTPFQMRQRLDERLDLLRARQHGTPSRHKGLRACMEWSYRLLSPELQPFFTCLSVFRGGWTLEAVEAVCAEPQSLEYLTQLRERSLIVAEERGILDKGPDKGPDNAEGEMRYRLLETLREYAWEQLSDSLRRDAIRRHANYFLHLALQAETHFQDGEQAKWMDRLEREHDNLRAALQGCLTEQDMRETGVRLAATLWLFWETRNHIREGREWLRRYLPYLEASIEKAAQEERAPTEAQMEALYSLARLTANLGDHAEAEPLYRKHLTCRLQAGDPKGVMKGWNGMAILAYHRGHHQEALEHWEKALVLARTHNSSKIVGNLLNNLGTTHMYQGRYPEAQRLFEESLQIQQEAGDALCTVALLLNLASVAIYQRDFAAARTFAMRNLALQEQVNSAFDLGKIHYLLGIVDCKEYLAGSGSLTGATEHYCAALRLFIETGHKGMIMDCFARMAEAAHYKGQDHRAARLWGAAERLRVHLGHQSTPDDVESAEEEWKALRQSLGEPAFPSLWNEGASMALEQAADYALQDGV